MARLEVTEESLRATLDPRVFAQAVTLAGKVAGLSAAGPRWPARRSYGSRPDLG